MVGAVVATTVGWMVHSSAFKDLGIVLGERLHGGHQSVVHRAVVGGADIVVKCELRPDPWLGRRMDVVAAAAAVNPEVVAPVRLEDDLVIDVGGRRCVLHPLVDGSTPDLSSPADAESMGRVLARLHATLRSIDWPELPEVSSLAALDRPGDPVAEGERQLIHGDFATSNLIDTGDRLRIIDFGELGFGTCVFEVANTLFMERFSAVLDGRLEAFERFASLFVAAYCDESGLDLTDEMIDRGVTIRRKALGRWLDDLTLAPVGITNSSEAWRTRLRHFVETDHHDWASLA